MAAPSEKILEDNNLSVTAMNGDKSDDDNSVEDEKLDRDYVDKWGFSIKEVYRLATGFLKEQEGKAFHLSYRDKLAFVAFTQQVTHGKFQPENLSPLGVFDVIGRDRRQAWSSLGDMSRSEAMSAFICLLDDVCRSFRPYVQAQKCDLEEKERLRQEAEKLRRQIAEEQERSRLEEEARRHEEMEKHRQSEQKRLIQEALNRQTYHQFKAYAEQQLPGNPDQQAVLIRQLQEQHYQQYMQQVLHQQLLKAQNHTTPMATDKHNDTEDDDASLEPDTSEEAESPPLAAASMWTRKDIKEFKESIRKEGGDGIIKVGHGETVTVRVPTHDDGTCLFWEFATDSYDVGFGVYFEWTKNPGTSVSVHISESEDDDEDEEEGEQGGGGDVERGVALADKPPVSVVIPVYRRDCHEEVYAGSHVYPGQGIYLLKFDNSYSLWRSKTLYYRVYYTR